MHEATAFGLTCMIGLIGWMESSAWHLFPTVFMCLLQDRAIEKITSETRWLFCV